MARSLSALRRLQRLAAIAEANARAQARQLAAAAAEARKAAHNLQQVTALIGGSGASPGAATAGALAAAAQLRSLLHPAEDAARTRIPSTNAAFAEAVRLHAAATGRCDALAERTTALRQAAAAEAEARSADDRVHPRRTQP